MESKAQGMPFVMIFTVIIGGVILFLAIFLSGRLFETGTSLNQAEVGRSLDLILNPFASIRQAGVTISSPLILPAKTNINFSCSNVSDSETISILLEKGKKPFPYPINNKYIFAEDANSKELWVFGKPFEMPWKVDDLIYVVSKDYCFIDTGMPSSIKNELKDLNSSFINITANSAICGKAVRVCFSGSCNITVSNYNNGQGVVYSGGKALPFFDDSTMYAAIFGPKQYECNLDRLLKRMKTQTSIMMAKVNIISQRGCSEADGLKSGLVGLNQSIATENWASIKSYSKEIESMNTIPCPIY